MQGNFSRNKSWHVLFYKLCSEQANFEDHWWKHFGSRWGQIKRGVSSEVQIFWPKDYISTKFEINKYYFVHLFKYFLDRSDLLIMERINLKVLSRFANLITTCIMDADDSINAKYRDRLRPSGNMFAPYLLKGSSVRCCSSQTGREVWLPEMAK